MDLLLFRLLNKKVKGQKFDKHATVKYIIFCVLHDVFVKITILMVIYCCISLRFET